MDFFEKSFMPKNRLRYFTSILAILLVFLIIWNYNLSVSINELKKHPEKVELIINPNDTLANNIRILEDSFNISILVPQYDNKQLSESLGVLNTASDIFGLVLTGVAIILTLTVAFGVYEMGTWRAIRKNLLGEFEKVDYLKKDVDGKLSEIEEKRLSFESLVEDMNLSNGELNSLFGRFKEESKEAQDRISEQIQNFKKKQENIVVNNLIFSEFKDSILLLFKRYQNQIHVVLDNNLTKVENATFDGHSQQFKNTLKEYLFLFRVFGTLLDTVDDEELALQELDYSALGMATFFEENYVDSVHYFNKVIEKNQTDYLAYFRLGFIYFIQKKFELAQINYQRSIELNSKFLNAIYNHAATLFQLEEYNRSEGEYRKVIEINSNYLAAYNGLAGLYITQERLEEADKILDELLRIDAKHHQGLYNKACLYSVNKNKEITLLFLEKALIFGPEALRRKANEDKYFLWLREDHDFLDVIN